MSSYTTLQIEAEGPVDWVTLNRPDRLNAISGAMVRELRDYFAGLQDDHGRRIVVLRGAGRGFCAGLDVKALQEAPGEFPTGDDANESGLPAIVRLMRSCPQPIIALVHGPACGGGLIFALAADIRIAGVSAQMNDAFIKLGLSGCELGISYFLPKAVGLSVAAELMMTGRFIDAQRALSVGLVSYVAPDDEMSEVARQLIADMLRTSPMGLRKTKQVFNRALQLNDLDAIIDLEQRTQFSCMRSGDFTEAMQAFIEKREPRFAATTA